MKKLNRPDQFNGHISNLSGLGCTCTRVWLYVLFKRTNHDDVGTNHTLCVVYLRLRLGGKDKRHAKENAKSSTGLPSTIIINTPRNTPSDRR